MFQLVVIHGVLNISDWWDGD